MEDGIYMYGILLIFLLSAPRNSALFLERARITFNYMYIRYMYITYCI
jgi:hypothetical protein